MTVTTIGINSLNRLNRSFAEQADLGFDNALMDQTSSGNVLTSISKTVTTVTFRYKDRQGKNQSINMDRAIYEALFENLNTSGATEASVNSKILDIITDISRNAQVYLPPTANTGNVVLMRGNQGVVISARFYDVFKNGRTADDIYDNFKNPVQISETPFSVMLVFDKKTVIVAPEIYNRLVANNKTPYEIFKLGQGPANTITIVEPLTADGSVAVVKSDGKGNLSGVQASLADYNKIKTKSPAEIYDLLTKASPPNSLIQTFRDLAAGNGKSKLRIDSKEEAKAFIKFIQANFYKSTYDPKGKNADWLYLNELDPNKLKAANIRLDAFKAFDSTTGGIKDVLSADELLDTRSAHDEQGVDALDLRNLFFDLKNIAETPATSARYSPIIDDFLRIAGIDVQGVRNPDKLKQVRINTLDEARLFLGALLDRYHKPGMVMPARGVDGSLSLDEIRYENFDIEALKRGNIDPDALFLLFGNDYKLTANDLLAERPDPQDSTKKISGRGLEDIWRLLKQKPTPTIPVYGADKMVTTQKPPFVATVEKVGTDYKLTVGSKSFVIAKEFYDQITKNGFNADEIYDRLNSAPQGGAVSFRPKPESGSDQAVLLRLNAANGKIDGVLVSDSLYEWFETQTARSLGLRPEDALFPVLFKSETPRMVGTGTLDAAASVGVISVNGEPIDLTGMTTPQVDPPSRLGSINMRWKNGIVTIPGNVYAALTKNGLSAKDIFTAYTTSSVSGVLQVIQPKAGSNGDMVVMLLPGNKSYNNFTVNCVLVPKNVYGIMKDGNKQTDKAIFDFLATRSSSVRVFPAGSGSTGEVALIKDNVVRWFDRAKYNDAIRRGKTDAQIFDGGV